MAKKALKRRANKIGPSERDFMLQANQYDDNVISLFGKKENMVCSRY